MAPSKPVKRSWEDYFIPGTTVLRNKFTGPGRPYGETDPDIFRQLEEQFTAIRLIELWSQPIIGQFDYEHMKSIHKYIFQDVYEWAGEERTAPDVPMMKNDHLYYPAGQILTSEAEKQYSLIAESNYLRGLSREIFVSELAERWSGLNVV
ncbi:MAG: cell filamentation protein Fic, partial [Actinomycetales bacterium]